LLQAGILVFITIALNAAIVHTLLTRKKSAAYCIATFMLNTLVVFVAFGVAILLVHNRVALKYVHYLCAFAYIVYIYLVFEESVLKKLFTMFSVWIFSMIAVLVGSPLAGLLSPHVGGIDVHLLAHIFRAFVQVMLLAAGALWIGARFKKVLSLVSDRMVGIMSLYPVIGFVLLVNNYFLPYEYVRYSGSAYEMLFFLSFVVLGYVLVFAGVSSASQIMSLQYDLEMKARDISERKRAAMEQEKIISELREAVSQVKQLSGLLPICASCKKIRNDQGEWEQLESYIGQRSKADFSHAICPECASKLYPEYRKKV
jgi:hypothetical protein